MWLSECMEEASDAVKGVIEDLPRVFFIIMFLVPTYPVWIIPFMIYKRCKKGKI